MLDTFHIENVLFSAENTGGRVKDWSWLLPYTAFGLDPNKWPFHVKRDAAEELYRRDTGGDWMLDAVSEYLSSPAKRRFVTNSLGLPAQLDMNASVGESFVEALVYYPIDTFKKQIDENVERWVEDSAADTMGDRVDRAWERAKEEEMGL